MSGRPRWSRDEPVSARLGGPNQVRGCPGWYYGLRVRRDDGSVYFDVTRGGDTVPVPLASAYRTTTLARRMGERDLLGYEHAARIAIRAFEAVPR